MPPKEALLHRPITRSRVSSNEASSIVPEMVSIAPTSSNFLTHSPSSSSSPPLRRSSLSRSSDFVDDAQGSGNENPLPTSENGTCSIEKRGRGASTGKTIEKTIADNDGKLLEIEFPKGFKKPLRFANHLANGIGIVVRHSSELDCIKNWNEVLEYQKLPVYAGLDKRSKTNADNRSHLPYSHTSGSKSFHTRLLQMGKQSDVDNFANTHMKNGIFINEKAAKVHAEMENKRNQVKDSGGSPVPEREIVRQSLGKRPGYEKGLGYGVVPSKCTKRTTCEFSQIEALKEKLISAEEELQDATSRIKSQVEIINNYNERCQRQDEEIASLRVSQDELKKMMLTIMQKNNLDQPCK
ncbi:hypothetical protein BUALT_Bualt17G0013100 [Buddleja alternifolia]|uniref:Uncharacterized protein n=1 Tax=Buddleja alternifolia TaxID=168488 RepID=A0AAV6W5J9_9LAMI|nr:hypothetical protein BUALT_Bualt17G0013100 [Buddleja alternifolia]